MGELQTRPLRLEKQLVSDDLDLGGVWDKELTDLTRETEQVCARLDGISSANTAPLPIRSHSSSGQGGVQ